MTLDMLLNLLGLIFLLFCHYLLSAGAQAGLWGIVLPKEESDRAKVTWFY